MKDAHHFLDMVSESVLVLNELLQIVYANPAFLKFCGQEASQIYGKKFGNVLGCEFHETRFGGCGNSPHCAFCQSMNTIINAQKNGLMQRRPCSVSLKGWESVELLVQSTPHNTEIGQFIYVSLKDISDLHRRETLERIFLHDILNTAGGMKGLAEMLSEGEELLELRDYILYCTEELIDEIEAQRMILSAERGQLQTQRQSISPESILDSIQKRYRNHKIAIGKNLTFHSDVNSFCFQSDPTLLKRILNNMVKNALEASSEGETVTLTVRNENQVVFEVHNPAVMSYEVKMQLFRRSFSTKGPARGLGTYSIRMLGEKYLGGKVSFDSEPEKGTTFRITLPLCAG